MSEWFPQVVKIEKIEKHPNADNLSICYVLGDYPVIIKTGQYNVGDLVGYVLIDSIVPDTEQFYFLCPQAYEKYEEDSEIKTRPLGPKYPVGSVPEKNRIIKAKKIRSIYSMGLLVDCPEGMNEGDSIVDYFGLKKWVEEVDDDVVFANAKHKNKGANAAKPPTGWNILYYDVEGIRKYLNCFLPNEEIVLLEKINGSNSGFCFDGNKLWVKSRNYYKRTDEADLWWDAALRYDLENRLSKFPMMVFYGELTGTVKRFRYDAEIINGSLQTKLYFFDIYDVSKSRYLDYEDSISIIKEVGLNPVPEIYKGPWLGKDVMYPLAEGKTLTGGNNIREGWVMKPLKERFESRLGGRWQGKLISEAYTLSK